MQISCIKVPDVSNLNNARPKITTVNISAVQTTSWCSEKMEAIQ